MSTFTPPKTYKIAAVTKLEVIEIVEREWREPQQGEIVVKVLACGVCRSDELLVMQAYPGAKLGTAPGHEIVGEVVSVPPSEKRWAVGDRVGSGWHGGHCHICDSCRGGEFVACKNSTINGILRDGGYGEYVTLKSEAVSSVPKDMDPAEVAPLLCAGVTTFNSLRNMGLKPGDVVAVQGIGGLGHLAIQYCRAMGLYTVALSSGPQKESLCKELGAHIYLDGSKVNQAEELQKLGGAKCVVATAPSPKVISTLVDALGFDGILLMLALSHEPMSIPGNTLIVKRASVKGWPIGHAKDNEETIAFSKLADVKCYVQSFPLEKAQEAYNAMMDGSAIFRAVIVP